MVSQGSKKRIAVAQINLGRMYQNGWGVTKDNKEAAKWYHKAAEQGHDTSQWKLGKMYPNGYKEDVDPTTLLAVRSPLTELLTRPFFSRAVKKT